MASSPEERRGPWGPALALGNLDRWLRGLSPGEKRVATRLLVVAGLMPVAFYLSWWLAAERWAAPALLPFLTLAVVFVGSQVLAAWFVYWRISVPEIRTAPPGLSVDVLVTAYDEPLELLERTVTAAADIRYPHRTWLLDDGGRPEVERLARGLGVSYRCRADRRDNKAGNVNAGLEDCGGEFVAVLDADHTPEPEFLDSVLGQFDDPGVGFVQTMVGHRNQGETAIARAACGQADDVFGPTSMGFHGCGAATAFGAHTTFRRRALDSIGGYRPGLAEDLNTSLALHAAGWKSVYVPRLLARGLVPADLKAHFIQHLKWSRGVFETMLRSPRTLLHLEVSQAVCYIVRTTYYLVGPVVLAHLLLLAWSLFSGHSIASYLVRLLPLLATVVVIRKAVGAMWEVDPRSGWQLRGTALAVVSWPIYTLSLGAAFLRIPLGHLSTPKVSRGGVFLGLALPQLTLLGVLGLGVAHRLRDGLEYSDVPLALMALVVAGAHWVLFEGLWEAFRGREAAKLGEVLVRGENPVPAGGKQ